MCFVCGKSHNDYESYKEHIITEHEEGREYLTCPACGAPVREMKSHYKVKHPKRVLPKGLQTRVAVWNDFGPSGKKKKTRKPTFRSGNFVSRKNGNIEIPYRSGMEADFYECLEEDVDVLTYQYEPFKVPYFYKGEWHDYIPDLRINFIDGSSEVWEIKPASQTAYEQNEAKWAAMHNHAMNLGWKFCVQTEVGLGKLQHKIRRQRVFNEQQSNADPTDSTPDHQETESKSC